MTIGDAYTIFEHLILGPLTEGCQFETSRHVSNTAFTLPPANRLPSYPSNGTLAPRDSRGPRRSQSCRVPPVHRLATNTPAPMALTHASDGIAPDRDFP